MSAISIRYARNNKIPYTDAKVSYKEKTRGAADFSKTQKFRIALHNALQ
jgi:hypothetical protein